jgi:tetratricopeptide (TPR) repeat protein
VLESKSEASSRDGVIADALARAQPDGIDGALVRSRLMASLFGQRVDAPRLGRFELHEQIGQGGMGVVYRAWDPQLERAVAIKLVDTAGLDPSLRERALREARSLAKLAHPNVITVFESGLADDRVWIAMEYVPGTTMRDWLARAPRPDDEAILRQWIAVGRGLIAVHDAGLVHRDVKPSNVLIGEDGRPRLIDFGLVRGPRMGDELLSSTGDLVDTADDSAPSRPLAATLGFIGTPAYAAPEQREGGSVGAAADQYAFCVSVWESLCEVRPPTLPEGVKLPARVQRALARGLAEQPEQRFATLGDLLGELEASVEGPSRRLGLLLGAAALGAVAAGIGFTQLREPAEAPQVCAIDERALDEVWDDARRDALRRRFSDSELEFAATSFAALEHGLDDWAASWLEARRVACGATRIEGVQSEAALDLRNACLDRKRRAVQVTIETLLQPDAGEQRELVARAPEILAKLPRIDDCADPERLAQIEPLPEPGPLRDAISSGYDVLAQARTLAATGALDRAQARTSEFEAAHADALGHTPLRLEFEAFPAQLELLRERTTHGIPKLVAVAREAEARRLDDLAATLLVEAAEAAAGHWSKPELEQWLVEEAEAALRRLDRPMDSRTVALRGAQASLLAQAGSFDEALATYEQARALARDLGDEPRVEDLQGDVSATLAKLGRFDDAQAILTAASEAARRRWGTTAPLVGIYAYELALLAIETGDFEGARTHLATAEDIARSAFGADSLALARVAFARTKLDMVEGEFTSGLARVDATIAIYSRELGPEHELLGDPYEARGVLRFFTGDLVGSIESYEAALRIRSRVLGPEHPVVALLYSNIGESQLALGRLDEAQINFDRALAIFAWSVPANHPDLAHPLKGRGQVALADGRFMQAVEDLERALVLQLEVGAEPLEIADLRISLAHALRASEGRKSTRALALALEARADFEEVGMRERVAAIDEWLQR